MNLLKDNNYKDINIALLSLESDIKNRIANFDTSSIDKQLAEINERIDEINAGSGSSSSSGNNSAEINDLRAEIENINTEINTINSDIDNIEQKLSKIFLAKNYAEDFDTATEPVIYWWGTSSLNRPPVNYGVLLVNRSGYDKASSWIYQTAYATDAKIYYRVKINEADWTGWRTIAFEDITKTYTIPDVTTTTARYIKLGTFPWKFSETVKVLLRGGNFEDTVEFNVLGGNGSVTSVNGWYTTNNGKTTGIYVVQVDPTSWASNVEVWLRVEQYATLTVSLTGNAKAAQYFNTNPQMNYTTTFPSGAKAIAYFNMKRGYFGYNESTLNCYETSMVGLGFTTDQVVSVSQFAQALINYTGTSRGQVRFLWADANRAYIKATTPYNTQLEISGGTVIFTNSGKNVSDNWTVFEAEYINRLGELYTIGIQKDTVNTLEYVRKGVDTSITNALRKNVDEGYLCKHYDIGGHTNQAYNVILLGKIPDPASTAAPATPSTSWDIDVDFYFVRSQGHKASWCNVKAGYGYSNDWRKYGLIETFGIDVLSNYTNPFYLVTLKYNNEWYIGVKHYVSIDGNYAARVHSVNIAGGRNPSSVANTPLANVLKAIGYLKTDGTVLNSEINSSIANFNASYAPTVERNGGLVIKTDTDVALDSYGKDPLSIGPSSGANIGIDGYDIQARFNGNASSLDLNYYGGLVRINGASLTNGGLMVGGRLNIPTSAPSNPSKGDIWLVL